VYTCLYRILLAVYTLQYIHYFRPRTVGVYICITIVHVYWLFSFSKSPTSELVFRTSIFVVSSRPLKNIMSGFFFFVAPSIRVFGWLQLQRQWVYGFSFGYGYNMNLPRYSYYTIMCSGTLHVRCTVAQSERPEWKGFSSTTHIPITAISGKLAGSLRESGGNWIRN